MAIFLPHNDIFFLSLNFYFLKNRIYIYSMCATTLFSLSLLRDVVLKLFVTMLATSRVPAGCPQKNAACCRKLGGGGGGGGGGGTDTVFFENFRVCAILCIETFSGKHGLNFETNIA
jgi:hypothetical protein